jgi:hypothetical protein
LRGLLVEHLDEQPADDLALGLGVGDAGEGIQKTRLGIDRITLTPRLRANTCITWSPSWWRSRPLSTNTQVSWSPMARCSSAATTDESTPPDRPSSTLPSPTCRRTAAMASAMMLPGVQALPQPQMSCTKRS